MTQQNNIKEQHAYHSVKKFKVYTRAKHIIFVRYIVSRCTAFTNSYHAYKDQLHMPERCYKLTQDIDYTEPVPVHKLLLSLGSRVKYKNRLMYTRKCYVHFTLFKKKTLLCNLRRTVTKHMFEILLIGRYNSMFHYLCLLHCAKSPVSLVHRTVMSAQSKERVHFTGQTCFASRINTVYVSLRH